LRALWSGNVLVGSTLLPFLLVMVVSTGVGTYERLNEDTASRDESCRQNAACIVASSFRTSLLTLNILMLGLTTLPLHTTPPVMWGRAMELAARKTGDLRARRVLALPYLATPAYLSCLYQILHQQLRLGDSPPPGEVIFLFCVQTVTFFFFMGMLYANLILQDMASLLYSYVLGEASPLAPRIRRLSSHKHPPPASSTSEAGEFPSVASIAGHPESEITDSTADLRREVLLLVNLILWSQRVLSRVALWEVVLVVACRGVAVALLLLSRDVPSTFESIAHEAGFGLVVEAKALRKALSRLVAGNTAISVGLARLPRYKATLQRMQDTLAVSYRWQTQERPITAEISLNMSDFQISCLLEAIRRSRAKYVWLDRLSVPQADCSLKYTILARMMAVYAAARSTVVIRSAELPGSRYHQRAWTFQEFCASCELDIRTERTDMLESAQAVQGDEQGAAEDLRARFQGNAERVVPFWLRDEETCAYLPRTEAIALVAECRALGARLSCQVAGDKIRALLPLLTGTPVEGQAELISLVLRISSASGQDLQDWKSALLEQHMTLRRAKVMGPRASYSGSVAGASSAGDNSFSSHRQPKLGNDLIRTPSYAKRSALTSPGEAAPNRQGGARGIQSSFMVTAVKAQGGDVGGRGLQRSRSDFVIDARKAEVLLGRRRVDDDLESGLVQKDGRSRTSPTWTQSMLKAARTFVLRGSRGSRPGRKSEASSRVLPMAPSASIRMGRGAQARSQPSLPVRASMAAGVPAFAGVQAGWRDPMAVAEPPGTVVMPLSMMEEDVPEQQEATYGLPRPGGIPRADADG